MDFFTQFSIIFMVIINMKIKGNKSFLFRAIGLDIIILLLLFIPDIALIFAILNYNLLNFYQGYIITIIILIPNIIIVGNIIEGIILFKKIFISINDSEMVLSILKPQKNAAYFYRIFSPYKLPYYGIKGNINPDVYIPFCKIFKINSITKYGYAKDLKIKKFYVESNDIAILTDKKMYIIYSKEFKDNDLYTVLLKIYNVTGILPFGDLSKLIETKNE